MIKVTCPKCGGNGLYTAPSSNGPYCFPCNGTGLVTPRRVQPAKVAAPLSATVAITSLCAGRPVRNPNSAMLAYLGLTEDGMLALVNLWEAGVREVQRGDYR